MQELIDGGRTGGIMTLVARRGTIVHWEAQGWRVLDEDPLDRNDVFRIYSMSKPITSTAVMMLVEDGAIQLDQPLSDFISKFADVQVYDEGGLSPPTRAVTIRDLLRHTSGLTYGVFGNTPVDQMYVRDMNALGRESGRTLAETIDVLAGLPLLADPGALWNYSMSTDVLGRVVEVASGMSLAEFFQTRIFEPLGMDDTSFHVEPRNLDRFTAVYGPGEDGLRMIDSPVDGPFTRAPSWYSGGGGLTSSAQDYLRFTQMLLNEGELDGVRLLRPGTIRDMRSSHIADELMPIRLGAPITNHGFGLGFAVAVAGDTPETYWWAGVASTWFWIDPVEEIVAFAWTQYQPLGGVQIDPILRRIVYSSITESVRAPVAAN
jgi:CubicO group peptidase (beta-lactamase class C family)